MEETLLKLASFIQFVQSRNPDLAKRLEPLAMEWIVREGIPLGDMIGALKRMEEAEGISDGVA